jgi:tetratricopeptide (TPR) repeat protein
MTGRLRSFPVLFVGVGLLVFWAVAQAQPQPDYAQAEALVREGQLDRSIAMLKQLLEAEPQNLKALNLLGIALTGKGDLGAANAQFEHALRIDPHFVPVLKNLSINELSQKKLSDAQRHLTAALALAPEDPVIHGYLGKIAYASRDYRGAVAHLSKAGVLANDPNAAALLAESYLEIGQRQQALEVSRGLPADKLTDRRQFALGLAFARHQLYEQAIPYFETVQARHPESYDAAFNLGLCYVESRQYGRAIEVLREVAHRGHKTAELDNLLAEAYENNNQIQEAIDALREATRLEPEDEDNYVDLATLCTNYEAYKLGLEVIDVGLHYLPQSDKLIFQRGVIHAMQSEFDLAEQDFQLAARLAPEKNLAYVGMGVSYMQSGNLPEAIRSLRQRLKRKPNDAILQFLLAEALVRAGAAPGDPAFVEAKEALEKSVKLNSRFPASQISLGKIYLKENRVDDAIQHLELARSLNPNEKTAYSQLALAYRRRGKPEQAAAMLATLNKLNDEDRRRAGRIRLRAADTESSSTE